MFIPSNNCDIAFHELFQKIDQAKLASYAHQLGLSEAEIADCLMETWLRIYKHSSKCSDMVPSEFIRYFRGVFRLAARDRLRQQERYGDKPFFELIHDLCRLPKAVREEVLEVAVAIRQIEQMKVDMPDNSPGLKRFKDLDPYRFTHVSEEVKTYTKRLVALSETDFQAVMKQSLIESDVEVTPVVSVRLPDEAIRAKMQAQKEQRIIETQWGQIIRNTLSHLEYKLFLLHDVHSVPYRTIAVKLNMSLGAVISSINEIHEKLRGAIKHEEEKLKIKDKDSIQEPMQDLVKGHGQDT